MPFRSRQEYTRILRGEVSRARALTFLLKGQSADGAWRDFHLAPGQSDAWVTAYVGSRVLLAAQNYPVPDAISAIHNGLSFLEKARRKSGGWGYNAGCEADADSTAQTLLFLRQAGCPPPLRDYAALARFQLADGSFATYKSANPDHGWGRGHPDVTATALRALAGVLSPGHVILRRGYASLSRSLYRPQPWLSYWWPSHLYLAREVLLLHNEQPQALAYLPPLPQVSDDTGCFEQALALEIGLLMSQPRAQLFRSVGRLLSLQDEDGGWPSLPILRVTDPRSKSLDDALCRSSHVARDDRRLFTSAAVLEALTLFDSVVSRAPN